METQPGERIKELLRISNLGTLEGDEEYFVIF